MWTVLDDIPVRLAVVDLNGVNVSDEKSGFERLHECAASYRSRYADTPIGSVPGVESARRLFHDIGLDPTKHRPASEALLNRALKEKELYAVNTLVDVGNWCSLDFLLPICVYDAGKIIGDVIVRQGRTGEFYQGLNGRDVHLEDRFVICDETGPFGTPMTDSLRTAVTLETKRALLLIYAPQNVNPSELRQKADIFASRAADVCGGSVYTKQII